MAPALKRSQIPGTIGTQAVPRHPGGPCGIPSSATNGIVRGYCILMCSRSAPITGDRRPSTFGWARPGGLIRMTPAGRGGKRQHPLSRPRRASLYAASPTTARVGQRVFGPVGPPARPSLRFVSRVTESHGTPPSFLRPTYATRGAPKAVSVFGVRPREREPACIGARRSSTPSHRVLGGLADR